MLAAALLTVRASVFGHLAGGLIAAVVSTLAAAHIASDLILAFDGRALLLPRSIAVLVFARLLLLVCLSLLHRRPPSDR